MKHNPNRFAKRDGNHGELAAVYAAAGCTVIDTSMMGWGFPDAVLGLATPRGRIMVPVEFKSADGTLTEAQVRWNRDWRGPAPRIVRTPDDVIAHLAELRDINLREIGN